MSRVASSIPPSLPVRQPLRRRPKPLAWAIAAWAGVAPPDLRGAPGRGGEPMLLCLRGDGGPRVVAAEPALEPAMEPAPLRMLLAPAAAACCWLDP